MSAKKKKKFPSGDVSNQQNDKTSMNSVPSSSKEPFHNTNHPKDSDPKLVSEEKISGHVAAHHVGGEFVYHFIFL